MKRTFQLTALATALIATCPTFGQTSALERYQQRQAQRSGTTAPTDGSVSSSGTLNGTSSGGSTSGTITGSTTSGSGSSASGSGVTTTATGGTTAGTGGTTSEPPTSGTPPTLSGGQLRVATRVAAPFATLAGSPENALALATSLRTGTTATLTSRLTDASGSTTTTTTSITPPTKPMGWGNVSHALGLATAALSNAGVTNPTAVDLQAALVGGNVTVDGKTVTLTGVLQQRADGMGWGAIAKSYGTTMGAVNRSIHTAAATSTNVTTTHAGNSTSTMGAAGTGIVSADGTSRGVSTLHGKGAPATPRGLTTATGTPTATSGVVTAAGNGHGNAYGRGIVTASGSTPGAGTVHKANASNGIVTASGNGGSLTRGHDNSGNGKGKNGG